MTKKRSKKIIIDRSKMSDKGMETDINKKVNRMEEKCIETESKLIFQVIREEKKVIETAMKAIVQIMKIF